MKTVRKILTLIVLLGALYFTQTSFSITRVNAESCMQTCSNYCSQIQNSCYEWCNGCPYYDGAFFQGYSSSINCAGGSNECYNNCYYDWAQCATDCFENCAGNP